MGTFLSLCYTTIETVCLILFLDAFSEKCVERRFFKRNVAFCIFIMCLISVFLPGIIGRNQALKIFVVLFSETIISKRLYTDISTVVLCFLVSIEYLLSTACLLRLE